jgi:hypothetical protein
MSDYDEASAPVDDSLTFVFPATAKDANKIHKDPVHLLPIGIEHNGYAPVSSFFRPAKLDPAVPTIPGDQPEHRPQAPYAPGCDLYRAAFRGRGVTGLRLPLPADIIGAVLEPRAARTATGAAATTNTQVSGKFDTLYTWGKDREPHDTAYVHRALREYIPLADAFHGTD